MKTFRTLVVLKRPHQELWTIMRDHLVDFAEHIADVEQIRQIDRTVAADGVVHIVNEWHVRQQLPAMIRSVLNTDELSWIDRNSWDARTYTCTWTMEPRFLTEHIACSGQMIFVPAMAGLGTRVTFEGGLDLQEGMLGVASSSAQKLLSGTIESIVATEIPRTLRAVVEAAAAFELTQ